MEDIHGIEDVMQFLYLGKEMPVIMSPKLRRHFLQEAVKSLPTALQNRIIVLKNLQLKYLKMEAEFFKEVLQLEKKYHQKFQPLFAKRKAIICGELDPPKEEPQWKLKPDEFDNQRSKKENNINDIPEGIKGIPNFWLKVIRNTPILSEMVEEHDEPLLQKLTDISVKYDDEESFTLEFHFDKNEYFSNEVLTKQYFLKYTVDEDCPFNFKGPRFYKCKGCNINWEKNMNLTVKCIRKREKIKEGTVDRTTSKKVPNYSFFNFFNTLKIIEDEDTIDKDSLVRSILGHDFEIGHTLRSKIVHRAVLLYTGDALDDYEKDDDSYYGEEVENDEESGVEIDNSNAANKEK